MEATMTTLTSEELAQLFEARQIRLAALEAALAGAPDDPETRFKRRLVARALYSTWLDMEELETAAVR
jgi:hypothetical protein